MWCLALIVLGVILILVGVANTTEANHVPQSSPPNAPLVYPQEPCDVCHPEDLVGEAPDVVRQDLEQMAGRVLQLRQSTDDPMLSEIEALLHEARSILKEGDTETARALIKHADNLASVVEKKAQFRNHFLARVNLTIAFSQQHELVIVPTALVRTWLPESVQAWTPLAIETLPTDQFLAEIIHRRAPPSEEPAWLSEHLNTLHEGLSQAQLSHDSGVTGNLFLFDRTLQELPIGMKLSVPGLSTEFAYIFDAVTAFGGMY